MKFSLPGKSGKGSKFGSYVFSKIKKSKSSISMQNIGMSGIFFRSPTHYFCYLIATEFQIGR